MRFKIQDIGHYRRFLNLADVRRIADYPIQRPLDTLQQIRALEFDPLGDPMFLGVFSAPHPALRLIHPSL